MRAATVTTKVVYLDKGELSSAMRKKGITDQVLAEKSGHSLVLIHHIMEGRQSVDLKRATEICAALGIQFFDLFGNAFD